MGASDSSYLAPEGADTNDGSKQAPFAALQRGDTVLPRGGTYLISEAQIARKQRIRAYCTQLDKSGARENPIRYWAYPNEKPIFDFSNVKLPSRRVIAFSGQGRLAALEGAGSHGRAGHDHTTHAIRVL